MPKQRILVCTIGATPQVVTETVWSLRHQDPAWVPDAIHIVTTARGLPLVRTSLHASDGCLSDLMGDAFPPVTIHVPRQDGTVHLTPSGPDHSNPADLLQDVHSEQEAAIMGNVILRLIAGFTNNDNTELHVSLAGGRKTMSAHALMALSLVGRLRDKASHVLISPEFESHPGFWHPSQTDSIVARNGQPLDPSTAIVQLVPTPVPLMRHRVARPEDLAKLDLINLVQRVNLAILLQESPSVTLDVRSNAIMVGEVKIVPSAKLFAIYRVLAVARQESWCDGNGLSYQALLDDETPSGISIRDKVFNFLRESEQVENPTDPESLNLPSNFWKLEVCEGAYDGVQTFFGQGYSHLRNLLELRIGIEATDCLLPPRRRGGMAQLALSIPSDAITILL